MPLLSKPAFGPKTAIIYITLGALVDVWTGVWYFAFARGIDGALTRNTQFWLFGFFLTGLTFIVVGMLLGHIGRAARRAELPPAVATPAEAAIQETAAANPQPVVAGNGAAAAIPAQDARVAPGNYSRPTQGVVVGSRH